MSFKKDDLDFKNNTTNSIKFKNDKEKLDSFHLDFHHLKNDIIRELKSSGFIVNKNILDHGSCKIDLRNLHRFAVENMRNKYRDKLENKENNLIKFIANGNEISPENIEPKLTLVNAKSKYWDLFNYIKIHWSIPISQGYGRRLRYVVFDKNTNKVMGILGLADPVFSIRKRDEIIGWNKEQKKANMSKVMDGFVIGSVPPYSMVLGGKLIASILFSNQVRKDFSNRYKGTTSLISRKVHSGDLVLITTLSALGKSAIYDRIKLPNGQKFISVGFSGGYGEFHFNGTTYENMKKLVLLNKPSSQKKKEWGTGFRNKREVVGKALSLLNISWTYSMHGVKREQFLIPLAKNYKEVLCKNTRPDYYDISIEEISQYMIKRWIVPRAKRKPSFKDWMNKKYLLWNSD